MLSKKVVEIVVEILEVVGVCYCYGIVGDIFNYVIDVIYCSQIQWVYVCYEEVVVFVVGVEFYISGCLIVCVGFCGLGSLYFINGVYEVQCNCVLMVLIVSQIVIL